MKQPTPSDFIVNVQESSVSVAGDNTLANPMIDPISCGGDVAHVPVP
jgi:hypothetical protein